MQRLEFYCLDSTRHLKDCCVQYRSIICNVKLQVECLRKNSAMKGFSKNKTLEIVMIYLPPLWNLIKRSCWIQSTVGELKGWVRRNHISIIASTSTRKSTREPGLKLKAQERIKEAFFCQMYPVRLRRNTASLSNILNMCLLCILEAFLYERKAGSVKICRRQHHLVCLKFSYLLYSAQEKVRVNRG